MVGIGDAGLLMFSSTRPIDSDAHPLALALHGDARTWPTSPARTSSQRLSTGVLQDMRIWKNKIHRASPVLCEADTFLVEFRKWVRQFYSTPPGEVRTEAEHGPPSRRSRPTATRDCRPSAIATTSIPQYRETFDVALPLQLEEVRAMRRRSSWSPTSTRSGARAATTRSRAPGTTTSAARVLDGDGIAGEVIFPDGITEMNMPPFGAGLSLPTDERIVPELQWAGARAHNRWLAEFCQMAPERRAGVAIAPICWDVDEAVRRSAGRARTGCAGS